jgi:hypothetical protein
MLASAFQRATYRAASTPRLLVQIVFGATTMVMVELSPEHEKMLRDQHVSIRERLLGELGIAESKGLPTSVVMADSIEKFYTGEAIPDSGNLDEYLDAASDAPAPIEYELVPLSEILPEPARTNFRHALQSYLAMAGVVGGSKAAVETSVGNTDGIIPFYQGSTWESDSALSDLLRNPGWNTIATGIHTIPDGWESAPAIVLVDISRLQTLPATVCRRPQPPRFPAVAARCARRRTAHPLRAEGGPE